MHSHSTMNRGQCSIGKFLLHQQLWTLNKMHYFVHWDYVRCAMILQSTAQNT